PPRLHFHARAEDGRGLLDALAFIRGHARATAPCRLHAGLPARRRRPGFEPGARRIPESEPRRSLAAPGLGLVPALARPVRRGRDPPRGRGPSLRGRSLGTLCPRGMPRGAGPRPRRLLHPRQPPGTGPGRGAMVGLAEPAGRVPWTGE